MESTTEDAPTSAFETDAAVDAELSIVVIRADGTKHDLGVVSSPSLWHRVVGKRLATRRIKKANEQVTV